ncbi:hypothetical protein [Desnuesiella massiliensis]|uniref:hypothetical protein n=1 Tax=Desnuesiella massiliensis TaxID=1650662 RepID=UPI0006E2EAD6|nr:hypothetical protein [Desnuesiella massiliensis]
MYRKLKFNKRKGNISLISLVIMLIVIDILVFEVSLINMTLKQSRLLKYGIIKENSYKKDVVIILTSFYDTLTSMDIKERDHLLQNDKVSMQRDKVTLIYDSSVKYIRVKYPHDRDYVEELYLIKSSNDELRFIKFFIEYS